MVALREALSTAVLDRARGRRTAIFLSDGRDSASVPVAAAHAGVEAVCVTNTFVACPGCCDAAVARQAAERYGHSWVPAPAPEELTDALVEQLEENLEVGGHRAPRESLVRSTEVRTEREVRPVEDATEVAVVERADPGSRGDRHGRRSRDERIDSLASEPTP